MYVPNTDCSDLGDIIPQISNAIAGHFTFGKEYQVRSRLVHRGGQEYLLVVFDGYGEKIAHFQDTVKRCIRELFPNASERLPSPEVVLTE